MWSLSLSLSLVMAGIVLASSPPQELPPLQGNLETKDTNQKDTGGQLTAVSSTVIPVFQNRSDGESRQSGFYPAFFYPSYSRRLGGFDKSTKPDSRVRLITKNRKLKALRGEDE